MNRPRRLGVLLAGLVLVVVAPAVASAQTSTTTSTTSLPPPSACGIDSPCDVLHDIGTSGYVDNNVPHAVTVPEGYPGGINVAAGYHNVGNEYVNTTAYDLKLTGVSGYQPGFAHVTQVTLWIVDADNSPQPTLTSGVSIADNAEGPVYFNVIMFDGEDIVIPPGGHYILTYDDWWVTQAASVSVEDFSLGQSRVGGVVGGDIYPCFEGVCKPIGARYDYSFLIAPKGYLVDPSPPSSTTTTPGTSAPGTTAPPPATDPGTLAPPPPVVGSTGPAAESCSTPVSDIPVVGAVVDSIACSLSWVYQALQWLWDKIHWVLDAIKSAIEAVGAAVASLASDIGSAVTSLLRSLFIPSTASISSITDPVYESNFMHGVTQLATLPVSMVQAAQDSVGSSCPPEQEIQGHSFGLCSSIAAVTAVSDWSVVRLIILAAIGFFAVVGVYKRITDRVES